MRPLTATTPKPLLNLHNQTLLGHQLEFLKNHVESLAVTVGYQSGKVAEYAIRKGANFVINNFKNGNASWVNQDLIRSFNGQILIITCDNLMEFDLHQLYLESSQNPESSFIVTTESSLVQEGDRVFEVNNQVKEISSTVISPLVASGLQILNPMSLTEGTNFEDFHEVWIDLIRKDLLCVSKQKPIRWSAIDTRENLDSAHDYWADTQTPRK